jgi:hypothetical protein
MSEAKRTSSADAWEVGGVDLAQDMKARKNPTMTPKEIRPERVVRAKERKTFTTKKHPKLEQVHDP